MDSIIAKGTCSQESFYRIKYYLIFYTSIFSTVTRRYMAEILPIRRKTITNQSINQSINQSKPLQFLYVIDKHQSSNK